MRRLKAHQPAGRRQKITKRVFCIDAALHGPTVAFDLGLLERQFFPSGHPDHQLHQIQPGDAFCDRMLDLQTGVHFEKVKALVLADHELHRAGALVLHRLGQLHRLLAHGFACGVADKRAGRFFNHLLVTALNGAFTLVQVNHVAVAVTDQLYFDVARLFNKLLDEHAVVAKTVARLVAATGEAFKRLSVVIGHPQALATATGRGLDHHGVTNTLGNFNRLFGRLNSIVHAGNAVHTGGTGELFGLDLVAHGGNRIVLGADEDNALFFHPLGKAGVLAQEAVARMHRLRAGLLAGGNDFFSLKVAFTAWRRADVNSLISQCHMACVLVSIGVNRHRLDAHLAGSEDDTAGDFPAVGDQDFGEHAGSFIFLGPLGARRIRFRECPPPALQAPPLFRCSGYAMPPALHGSCWSAS